MRKSPPACQWHAGGLFVLSSVRFHGRNRGDAYARSFRRGKVTRKMAARYNVIAAPAEAPM